MTHSLTAMKQFDGSDPKVCRNCQKNVNKYLRLTGQKHVAVAYETPDGPVLDAISEGSGQPELKQCWKEGLEMWQISTMVCHCSSM